MVLIPIYSQLPSISGGRLLHPQPEDAPCRGDRDSHSVAMLCIFNEVQCIAVSVVRLPSQPQICICNKWS